MGNDITQQVIAYFNNNECLVTGKKNYEAVLRGKTIIVKHNGCIEENIKVLDDGSIGHKNMTFSTFGEWLYWFDI
ncbi:hypothetical protein BCU68_12425 [Vibrio sp. 10N.286.49.B3]|uniref:hypothetical protein n=1 Tax=Vibrio sp. 10N.286.49.B3 TaxID=1880855 RepID=UPI000C8345BA|nr:hypothetical protein [Vibrio sp. 10N.286.49.B3]PMH44647.1 hypothetical protein BCU68_12425 [Vibrio sp. 10N.286.49.B3]